VTDVSEVLAAAIISSITVMMEAVGTPETLVNFYDTARHNIQEESHVGRM
jgi:hypothetical protein